MFLQWQNKQNYTWTIVAISPMDPNLQFNDPAVFVQSAGEWQLWLSILHSPIS